jgi:hypothetical protein
MTAFRTSERESSNVRHPAAYAITSAVSRAAQAQAHAVSRLTSINATIQRSSSTSSDTHPAHDLKDTHPHNTKPAFTAQRAKALEEDRKDVLRVTDLVRFWEVSLTSLSFSVKEDTKRSILAHGKSIHYFLRCHGCPASSGILFAV